MKRHLTGFFLCVLFLIQGWAFGQIRCIPPMSEGPSFVRVETPVVNARTYSATVMGYNGSRYTFPDLDIEPGGSRVLDMTTVFGPAATVQIRSSAGSQRFSGATESRAFLVLADVGQWPTASESQAFSMKCKSSGVFADDGYRGSTLNVVESVSPEAAPVNWRNYIPFIGVIVPEPTWRRLKPVAQSAVMAWVSQGGSLVIYGAETPATERVLKGYVHRVKESPIKGGRVFRDWRGSGELFWPIRGQGDAQEMLFEKNYPFAVDMPSGRLGGMILATLFFIIAGPVNYLMLRKRDQIRRLMVTLPLLSLGFCVVMIVFFFVMVGFSRKGGTLAFSFMDQDRALGYTYARSALISGIYPLGGFEFSSDTQFAKTYGRESEGHYYSGYRSNPYDSENFEVEIRPGTWRLVSGLFKPSVRFDYYTVRTFSSKERLLVDAERKNVINGFEAPIARVVLTDGNEVWLAEDIAEEGGRQALKKISSETDKRSIFRESVLQGALKGDVGTYCQNKFERLMVDFTDTSKKWKYVVVFDEPHSTVENGFDDPFGRVENILFGYASTLER